MGARVWSSSRCMPGQWLGGEIATLLALRNKAASGGELVFVKL